MSKNNLQVPIDADAAIERVKHLATERIINLHEACLSCEEIMDTCHGNTKSEWAAISEGSDDGDDSKIICEDIIIYEQIH